MEPKDTVRLLLSRANAAMGEALGSLDEAVEAMGQRDDGSDLPLTAIANDLADLCARLTALRATCKS